MYNRIKHIAYLLASYMKRLAMIFKVARRIAPQTFTIEDIRSWQPCYDPARHLPEDWNGTVLDILDHKGIPFKDKLWVICREELISDKLMRLFAVYCVRSVQHLMKDERSIKAIDVAERFALGQATREELEAARRAARAACEAASEVNKKDIQLAQQKKLREMIIEGLKTGDVK